MAGKIIQRLQMMRQKQFFKDEQIEGARKIREKMTEAEVVEARRLADKERAARASKLTIDTLVEVSQHSVIDTAVRGADVEREPDTSRAVERKFRAAVRAPAVESGIGKGSDSYGLLGRGRWEYLREWRQSSAPVAQSAVSKAGAEGLFVGGVSFVVATSIVSMVGGMGLLFLVTHPRVIDSWREKAKETFASLDSSLGRRLRTWSERLRSSGAFEVNETSSIRQLMTSVMGEASSGKDANQK